MVMDATQNHVKMFLLKIAYSTLVTTVSLSSLDVMEMDAAMVAHQKTSSSATVRWLTVMAV
jgi:hypothetical protein